MQHPETKPRASLGSPSTKSTKSLQTFTAAELARRKIPPMRWAVPGFLPEGVTVLAGPPKSGKSFLALQCAQAIARGESFIGLAEPEPAGVLYLALEDSDRRLKARQAMLFGADAQPDGLHYALSARKLDANGMSDLRAWLDAHPDVRVVIIDVFAKVRKPSKTSNVYRADYEALQELSKLCAERPGLAVLALHHTNKGEADDVLQAVSGSTGLTAAADAVMVLQREQGSADAELWITGRDVPSEGLKLRWSDDSGWSYAGEARKQLPSTRQKIVDALVEAGRPLGPAEISHRAKLRIDNVKQTVGRMVKAGQLERVEGGSYAPAGESPTHEAYARAA